MAVVIRLMRAGAKKRPSYRLVAADSRRQRDGRFLEILGTYNPITQPAELNIKKDRIEAWISQGAQPSVQVASLLRPLGVVVARAPKKAAVKKAGAKKAARRKPRPVSARKAKKRAAKKAAKKSAAKA